MAAEVGVFALEALVVVKVVKGKFLYVVIVLAFGVLDSLIVVKAFMLGSHHALLQYLLFQLFRPLDLFFQPLVSWGGHPLVARRA